MRLVATLLLAAAVAATPVAPTEAKGIGTSCLSAKARRIAASVGGTLVSTCRHTRIAGSRKWSAHSQGMAVDIIHRRRKGAEARGRAAGATCVIHYSWSRHIHFDHRDHC